MRPAAFSSLSDDELLAHVLQGRAAGEDVRAALGHLVERWRRPAAYVIRRVRQSYGAHSEEDELELFQEAVGKFVDRGLDQFRGISEQMPGKSASPKTFFLRIAKHVAIDRYRRQRESLASGAEGSEENPDGSAAQVQEAVEHSRRVGERAEASELYWRAFERLQTEHPNEASAWDVYHHQDVADHAAAAEALGISVTNSYKRVSRAQAYLRLYLLELQQAEES